MSTLCRHKASLRGRTGTVRLIRRALFSRHGSNHVPSGVHLLDLLVHYFNHMAIIVTHACYVSRYSFSVKLYARHDLHVLKLDTGRSTDLKHLSRGTAFPTRLHVRPAKTPISLRNRTVWSESSLSAWWRFGSLATYRMPCENSDQTVQIRRLIWSFARRTCTFVGNSVPRFICMYQIIDCWKYRLEPAQSIIGPW